MQRSREAPATYVGPLLFYDTAAFNTPTLPPGGLSAHEALTAYIEGAPVPLSLPSARLSVRSWRQPPANPWRRTCEPRAG
jgi:hypothetical protein